MMQLQSTSWIMVSVLLGFGFHFMITSMSASFLEAAGLTTETLVSMPSIMAIRSAIFVHVSGCRSVSTMVRPMPADMMSTLNSMSKYSGCSWTSVNSTSSSSFRVTLSICFFIHLASFLSPTSVAIAPLSPLPKVTTRERPLLVLILSSTSSRKLVCESRWPSASTLCIAALFMAFRCFPLVSSQLSGSCSCRASSSAFSRGIWNSRMMDPAKTLQSSGCSPTAL
mmetsp:Transcript_69114/g.164676  ORF Transcript_69114/g.164676 Transcript_69114/m.164676 type:complete len:225 (-) Transcript_69114:989-1663(-)